MSNANVGKVFNMTGGNGGGGTLKLETLAITKQPNKTVYKSGESFDPTGMVVTAGYGYGLTSDVTGYTVSPQVLTDGVTEVTITYTEGRITKTASVPVTVKKVLVSIAITANPTKMTYQYLETFDPAGMVVTATYSDESSEEVPGRVLRTGAAGSADPVRLRGRDQDRKPDGDGEPHRGGRPGSKWSSDL